MFSFKKKINSMQQQQLESIKELQDVKLVLRQLSTYKDKLQDMDITPEDKLEQERLLDRTFARLKDKEHQLSAYIDKINKRVKDI